jgi:hypothetical protein
MFIKYHQKKQLEDATEHGIEKYKTNELIDEYYNSNDCPKKENMDKRLHSLQSQVEQLQENMDKRLHSLQSQVEQLQEKLYLYMVYKVKPC